MGRRRSGIWPWIWGFAVLLGVPVAVVLLQGTSEALRAVQQWLVVYAAGAIGGLAMELLKDRWEVELPSYVEDDEPGDRESPFYRFGARVDTGVLGRMATAGIAAPVFLIIVAATGEARDSLQGLVAIGQRLDTIAWGVLVGVVSPTVWAAAEALVQIRIAGVQERLKIREQQLKVLARDFAESSEQLERAVEQAKAGDTAALDDARMAQVRHQGLISLAIATPQTSGRIDKDRDKGRQKVAVEV